MKIVWEQIDTNEYEKIIQQLQNEPGILLLNPSLENQKMIKDFFKKFEFPEFYSNGDELQRNIFKVIAFNINASKTKRLDLRDMNFYQDIKFNDISLIVLLSYFIDLTNITHVDCSQSDKRTSLLFLKDKNWTLFTNLKSINFTLGVYEDLRDPGCDHNFGISSEDNFGIFMFVHTHLPYENFKNLQSVTFNRMSLRLDPLFRQRFLKSNRQALQEVLNELKDYMGLDKQGKRISFFRSSTRTWYKKVKQILDGYYIHHLPKYTSSTDLINEIKRIREDDIESAWSGYVKQSVVHYRLS